MKKTKLICIFGIMLFLFGCSAQPLSTESNQSSSRYINSMDTVMKITAYGRNREEALADAEAEIIRLDELLSTENASSEIALINTGKTVEMSKDTQELIKRAASLYQDTNGLFDISIYPLTHLWGFPTKNYHVPSTEELQKVLSVVDFSKIQITDTSKRITLASGQAIDLGGIAKGYTSQKIMDIFQQHGITSGLVSLGGNIQCLGHKPDGSEWKIGIRDPLGNEGDLCAVVHVADLAVITSGGYERFFEDEETGIVYRHILDPITGYPAENGLSSVTIVTPDGTLGDGLSTALYIMGLEEAVRFWREHSQEFDAILIDNAGKLYITEGIHNAVETSNPHEYIALNG